MSLREKQKLERRQRILNAARELILRTGSTGLSMRALAEEAEVSLATPYNLFGSKSRVLGALLTAGLEKLQKAMDELRMRDPLDRLIRVAEIAADMYGNDPMLYRPLMFGLIGSPAGIHETALTSGAVELWQRAVEDAIGAGLLMADINPELLSRHLVISFLGVLDFWIRGIVDGEGLRTQILYSFRLALLAVATQASRPKLMKQLRIAQQQLPRIIRKDGSRVFSDGSTRAPAQSSKRSRRSADSTYAEVSEN